MSPYITLDYRDRKIRVLSKRFLELFPVTSVAGLGSNREKGSVLLIRKQDYRLMIQGLQTFDYDPSEENEEIKVTYVKEDKCYGFHIDMNGPIGYAIMQEHATRRAKHRDLYDPDLFYEERYPNETTTL